MKRARSTATAVLALAAALTSGAAAQDMELRGRVTTTDGAGIAGADVTFLPLPARARPRPGTRGRYRLAQAAHRAQARLPHTRTDRNGDFRCLVSPQVAALAAGSGVEMAMRVAADGYLTWMRAIGDGLEGADGQIAVLPRANTAAGPRLQVKVATGVNGVYRGFALIERAYRATPNRSVWLRDLLPIDRLGTVTFDEPARLPGEVPASLPTARAEGYRVTLYLAGLERWQHTLTEGRHEVHPEPSDLPPRRVLAERGEPARTPLRVAYEIEGEEVTLDLDEPAVPLLGGEIPTGVQSASGPVVVDAWDPDVAMFVDQGAPAAAGKAAPAAAAPVPTREAAFLVLDKGRRPLYGAALWLEDASARVMAPEHRPFAVTDPTGTARLSGLRPGTHWVLVRHPQAGEREVLLDTVRDGPTEVVLRAAPPREDTSLPTQPGSLLLDLEQRAGDEPIDVGVVQPGRRTMRRRFDERPRQVRLEGLTPGPVTVWVRVGEGPVHLVGGAMATADDEPPVHPLRAAPHKFTLAVRTHDGKPADAVHVSLGDTSPKGHAPLTSALLPLVRDGDTDRWTLDVRLTGDLWIVVHGPDDARRDVLLSSAGDSVVVAVSLPEPPPPPEAGGKETGKDGEGKNGDGKEPNAGCAR